MREGTGLLGGFRKVLPAAVHFSAYDGDGFGVGRIFAKGEDAKHCCKANWIIADSEALNSRVPIRLLHSHFLPPFDLVLPEPSSQVYSPPPSPT